MATAKSWQGITTCKSPISILSELRRERAIQVVQNPAQHLHAARRKAS
ncbi:MAG TPA: hypothetical protein VHX86_16010 [Tepidisphaeraceae bacterium]|nr:hypothetical protein [Tepidisphaeraceae bacterium]